MHERPFPVSSSISQLDAGNAQHRPPQVKCPLATTIVAWIFMAIGMLAIVGMVVKLMNWTLSFKFTAFMLPVGIGLLKGRRSSLGWARFWAGCSLILGIALLLHYPFAHSSHKVRFFGHEVHGWLRHPYAVGTFSFMILLGITAWRTVSGPAHRAYVAFWDGRDPLPSTLALGEPSGPPVSEG